jgi:hypothetical protein
MPKVSGEIMKRILDPQFEYQPSYATNIRDTFERVRRELQANDAKPERLPQATVRALDLKRRLA